MRRASFASILSLGALLFVAAPLHAQEDRFLSAMEYSIAAPLGDSQRFGSGSWSGAAWEGRWMDHPHTSFGMLLGFNEFYHRQSGTFNFPSGAATGDQYRHLLAIPLLVTSHWYFTGSRDDPRWYVGGGGGVQYTEQIFQLGLDQRRRSNWGIVLVPEIGIAFSAWYATGGILSLRYHLPTESGGFLGSTDRRFQYVSLSFGFGYR